VILIEITTIGAIIYFQLIPKLTTPIQEKPQDVQNLQLTEQSKKVDVDVEVKGRVIDYADGDVWVNGVIEFRDTKIIIKTQDGKTLTIIVPKATDEKRKCPFPHSPEIYDEIEVRGTETATDTLSCESPDHYIRIIEPTKSITLKSFTDSIGKEKFVVMDVKLKEGGNEDYYWWDSIYISLKRDETVNAVKIAEVGASSISKSPYISTSAGIKYLIIAKYGPGDSQDFILVDENGKSIKIDYSKMGLGTRIPGMYGLQFGDWVGNTTNFTIKAVSGNGHSYEATFDATTGKQVGETKQTD
jgi:hypothetical protein